MKNDIYTKKFEINKSLNYINYDVNSKETVFEILLESSPSQYKELAS